MGKDRNPGGRRWVQLQWEGEGSLQTCVPSLGPSSCPTCLKPQCQGYLLQEVFLNFPHSGQMAPRALLWSLLDNYYAPVLPTYWS